MRCPYRKAAAEVLLTGLCGFLFACGGGDQRAVQELLAQQPRTLKDPPQAEPKLAADDPQLRQGALRFMMERLDDAGALYAAVAKAPYDVSARRKLASFYRVRGYAALASFFEESAETAETADFKRRPKSATTTKWYCGHPMKDDSRSLAQRVSDLVTVDGKAAAAIDLAQSSLEKSGWSCQMGVEWANAVLHVLPRPTENWGTRESALRAYITNELELDIAPTSTPGTTDGFAQLSNYFGLMDDIPSGLTALILERSAIDTDPAFGGDANARQKTVQQVDAGIQKAREIWARERARPQTKS
jgi:hypothetical protein